MDVIFTSCATEAIEVYSQQLAVKAFSIFAVNCGLLTLRPAAHRHVPSGTFFGAELLHGAGKAKPRFTTEHTEVTGNSPLVCLRVLRALCGGWLFGCGMEGNTATAAALNLD